LTVEGTHIRQLELIASLEQQLARVNKQLVDRAEAADNAANKVVSGDVKSRAAAASAVASAAAAGGAAMAASAAPVAQADANEQKEEAASAKLKFGTKAFNEAEARTRLEGQRDTLEAQLDEARNNADFTAENAQHGYTTRIRNSIAAWFATSYVKQYGVDPVHNRVVAPVYGAVAGAGAAVRDNVLSPAVKAGKRAGQAVVNAGKTVGGVIVATPAVVGGAIVAAPGVVGGAIAAAPGAVVSAGKSVRDMIYENRGVLVASAAVAVMYDVTKKGLSAAYNKLAKRA